MNNKVKDIFNNLKVKFLNELFPEDYSCYNCSNEIKTPNAYHLCDDCIKEITPIKFPCKICGDELNSFTFVCENCKNRFRHFNYVSSVTTYDGVAKSLIHKLKYNGNAYIAKTISAFLADHFLNGKFDLIDLVVCVPITKEKLKIRGYNQAEEILKEFIKFYDIDYSLNCLKRIKNSITQTKLSRNERRENINNAFEFTNSIDITNKNILVIDDVITTGSTLDAVSKVLKENGANKVYGLTFCHTKMNTIE